MLLFAAAALLATLVSSAAATAGGALPALRIASPMPGSGRHLPQTGILVRGDVQAVSEAALVAAIRVTGSQSGVHAGTLRLADGGRAAVFQPRSPFRWGEQVTVELDPNAMPTGVGVAGLAPVTFRIADAPPPPMPPSVYEDLSPRRTSATSARPRATGPSTGLGTPIPEIVTNVYGPTAPGRLFLDAFYFAQPNACYLLILDDDANPVFSRQMAATCLDFKKQPDGRLTYFDRDLGKFYALDDAYAVVDSFSAGNGYGADGHELRLLPNGHALFMIYDVQTVDMSAIVPGGQPAASVVGLVIQELDEQKNVVFEWRSWDHMAITDATHEDLTAMYIDYVHGNALDVDTDGNLLLSSRHLDEITKIDRQTGDILWRMGGIHNEFTFVDDTLGFSHQHGIRRLDNGHMILFDNGNFHSPPFSRAVEYDVDESARTARLVWEYRATPDIYGFAMGFAQRLPNGNTLVSWGTGDPDMIEVGPDGTKRLDLSLPPGMDTYRGFRDEWVSAVSAPPGVNPHAPRLSAARPSPCRGRATFALSLTRTSRVTAAVYDVSGREVARVLDREQLRPGEHPFTVELPGAGPGLYFCRVVTGEGTATRRIVLTR